MKKNYIKLYEMFRNVCKCYEMLCNYEIIWNVRNVRWDYAIILNNISEERAFSIIKKPMMTEKSTNLNQYNQYSFVVSVNSCSYEIKKAIANVLFFLISWD